MNRYDDPVWRYRTPFSLPIFYHLLENEKKAKGLHKLLRRFRLQIKEVNHMPFFDLLPERRRK